MARLAQMQYLLVTTDARLCQALAEEVQASSASAVQIHLRVVADAAAAIRSTTTIAPDGCLLDGGVSASVAAECLAWWGQSVFRHGRLLVIEPRPSSAEEREVEFLPRDAAVILQALLRVPGFRLQVTQQRLSWGGFVVDLTTSETALLACLGRASEGLTAKRILCAAFSRDGDVYAPVSTGVVRTHLANIRRKCRQAGMAEVVITVGRRYETPSLIVNGESQKGTLSVRRPPI